MTGRYEIARHYSRWTVIDHAHYDGDRPIYTTRAAAEARWRQLEPTPSLFDKDPDMTQPEAQPSIWDEFDDGDFRRVPDGEVGAGSPLIIPEEGGEPVRYSRFTNFICAVEDDYGIAQWKRHLTVDGFLVDGSANPYAEQWDGADWNTKKALTDAAFDAAGGHEKANLGTRMHELTEDLDHGRPLRYIPTDSEERDLTAYRSAVAALTPVHIEPRMVYDPYGTAGTPDRFWDVPGLDLPVAGDLKSGKIDGRKCAMQMALAAHAALYDPRTGKRTAIEVDQSRALIIHLPYGEAKARVLWVDIAAGWEGVQLCAAVHAWRKRNGLTKTYKPLISDEHILDRIGRCKSADDLSSLWRAFKDGWTDAHTAAAKARLEALGQVAA